MSEKKALPWRVQQVARHKSILQHRRDAAAEEIAAWQQDDRWAEEYRAEQLDLTRRKHAAWGLHEARDAHKEAIAAVERSRVAYQDAAADAERMWNYSRIGIKQQEIAARLARPVNELVNDTPGRRMHDIRAELLRRGDHDGLRALRLAGEPYLQNTKDRNIGDLASLFAADEAAAQPEELRDAAAELAMLERLAAELRQEILVTEAAVSPPRWDPFTPLTPWRREIFGESEADFGGGVWSEGAPVRSAPVEA